MLLSRVRFMRSLRGRIGGWVFRSRERVEERAEEGERVYDEDEGGEEVPPPAPV
jgi:hypothetical protein